jgi:hypothetical protein
MAFFTTIIVIAAFLSVSAAAVFVLLVIGIRRGDRARHLSDAPDTALDALTRSFLGVGVRRSDREED